MADEQPRDETWDFRYENGVRVPAPHMTDAPVAEEQPVEEQPVDEDPAAELEQELLP